MPSAGKLNGTNLLVYVNGVAVAHATSHTLNVNAEMIDATTKSSAGWKDVLPGLKDWSIDCEGIVAWDATEGVSQAFADITGRTQVTVKFSMEVTGDKRYTGLAYVSTLSMSAPLEDVITYSLSFAGDGAITEETVT